jgi:hypothetical protein
MLDHQVIHQDARLGGVQPLPIPYHVAALLQRAKDRRIGRGPADTIFFERANQASLGEARWWLVKCCRGSRPVADWPQPGLEERDIFFTYQRLDPHLPSS